MTTINSPTLNNEKLPAQQSDIIIEPGGKVHISFLWDDLRDIVGALNQEIEAPRVSGAGRAVDDWAIPTVSFSDEFLEEFRSCHLCPKQCGFNRLEGRHPTCGDYRLRIATFGITLGDEPVIRGVNGSGAIMLSGCPLTCPSCHNPEMVEHGSPASIETFLKICKNLYQRGAHNIQILSPTVHLPTLRIALKGLKDNHFPIPIVFKSSGFESFEQLQRLDGLIDIYLPDIKAPRRSSWSILAGARNYFEQAKVAIEEMIRQVGPIKTTNAGVASKGVLVRHIEIPLSREDKTELELFFSELPPGVMVARHNNFVSLGDPI